MMSGKIKDFINDIKNSKKEKEGDFIPGNVTVDSITDDLTDDIRIEPDNLDNLEEEYNESVTPSEDGNIPKFKFWQIALVIAVITGVTIYKAGFPVSTNDDFYDAKSPPKQDGVSDFNEIETILPVDSFSQQNELIDEANSKDSMIETANNANNLSSSEIGDDILFEKELEGSSIMKLDNLSDKNSLLIDKKIDDLQTEITSIKDNLSELDNIDDRLSKLEKKVESSKAVSINKKTVKPKSKNHNIKLKSIIASADNCITCVDHALILYRGEELFIGHGDMFSGHKVSIVGDRLNLLKKGKVKHSYWISR